MQFYWERRQGKTVSLNVFPLFLFDCAYEQNNFVPKSKFQIKNINSKSQGCASWEFNNSVLVFVMWFLAKTKNSPGKIIGLASIDTVPHVRYFRVQSLPYFYIPKLVFATESYSNQMIYGRMTSSFKNHTIVITRLYTSQSESATFFEFSILPTYHLGSVRRQLYFLPNSFSGERLLLETVDKSSFRCWISWLIR